MCHLSLHFWSHYSAWYILVVVLNDLIGEQVTEWTDGWMDGCFKPGMSTPVSNACVSTHLIQGTCSTHSFSGPHPRELNSVYLVALIIRQAWETRVKSNCLMHPYLKCPWVMFPITGQSSAVEASHILNEKQALSTSSHCVFPPYWHSTLPNAALYSWPWVSIGSTSEDSTNHGSIFFFNSRKF